MLARVVRLSKEIDAETLKCNCSSLMMRIKVTLHWVEVFLLKYAAVAPEAIEVFANIPHPMCIVDGSKNRPLHMP